MTHPTTPEAERERGEFEFWAKSHGHDVVSCMETGGKFYVSSFTRMAWDIWQAARRAPMGSAEPVPAVLFDGNAVFAEITRKFGKSHCFHHTAVSATLDAVVRLIRAECATQGAHASPNTGAVEVPVNEMLQMLRNQRDYASGELRQAYNAACDRLDVLVSKLLTTPSPSKGGEVDSAAEWISVDERLPEVGVLVMVYAPPNESNWPGSFNISFDCIDPNDDDAATWQEHNENYEHYCCVAKPEGSTGPRERAPYTHWCAVPAPPIAALQPDTGEKK